MKFFTFKTAPVFLVCWIMLQEFCDPQDADDARCELNGQEFNGNRISVKFATGVSFCCNCSLLHVTFKFCALHLLCVLVNLLLICSFIRFVPFADQIPVLFDMFVFIYLGSTWSCRFCSNPLL